MPFIINFYSILRFFCGKYKRTRLIGRPQPQMYPPAAPNQHTGINGTHTHYITRQSEMANTSPRRMPVFGNDNSIKLFS